MSLSVLTKTRIVRYLHLSILLFSILLIVCISIEILKNNALYTDSPYFQIQFWICVWFLLCLFVELLVSHNRKKYFWSHFLFFLVSIPYLNLISFFQISVSDELNYIIRFVPLLRSGYAMAMVISFFTKSRISSLFVTYVSLLLAMVYFCSLMFYSLELKVNDSINSYGDALWWACMNVTTIGSNIIAVTSFGKMLSVMLGGIGMMLFPIFTVYLTNVIASKSKSEDDK